jgi:nitrite reductase/ring-hydroxylating ferredoxin subunit
MQHSLIAVTDIPDDGAVTIEFFCREILVYKVDGQPRATANVCTHLGGPLERCADTFVCAWHQGTFDVASGARLSGPARPKSRLMTLPTRVVDGVLTYVWAD